MVATRALVVALGLLAGACSIDSRSERFVCGSTADCTGGRVCEAGYCVSGTASIDAAPGEPDALEGCPSQCTRCDGTQCIIECLDMDACAARVNCPAGLDCVVTCSGRRSCGAGVNCAQSTSCTVTCGRAACSGEITCGSGPCSAECSGRNSCGGGVLCAGSCSCFTDCSGQNACQTPPSCPTDCENSGDCFDDTPACNTCT